MLKKFLILVLASFFLSGCSLSPKKSGLEIAEFTREMLETTDDKKVITSTKEKSLSDVEHLGILLFGNRKEVDALTKPLKLYS